MNVPKQLQGVLWSRDISHLDLQGDKNYIIHQILNYGNLEQIAWLKRIYSKEEIKKEFISKPRKLYTSSAFNFTKNYLLGIGRKLHEDDYVKNLPRNIR